jgi:hypothetical protein
MQISCNFPGFSSIPLADCKPLLALHNDDNKSAPAMDQGAAYYYRGYNNTGRPLETGFERLHLIEEHRRISGGVV